MSLVGGFDYVHDTNEHNQCGKRSTFTVTLVSLLIITLSVILGLGLGFGLRMQQDTDISTNLYSPGDSRLLFLSQFFCDGGVLELTSDSVDAELFLIDSVPPLNDANNFTVTLEQTFGGLEFRFWDYNLKPGSVITMSVRTDVSVDVYVVKGNDNANQWARNPSESLSVEFFTARGFDFPYVEYQVGEQDEYYVIIRSTDVSVNAAVTFDRFQYSPPENVSSCVVEEQGRCTISVPYGTGSQMFLVTTSIPSVVDYGENIRVNLRCDQRGWAYALVIILPSVIVGVTFFLCVLISLYFYIKCVLRSSAHDVS